MDVGMVLTAVGGYGELIKRRRQYVGSRVGRVTGSGSYPMWACIIEGVYLDRETFFSHMAQEVDHHYERQSE
jgi:hypothetical protein